jgi:3',5'-cyclic AMP phosphodiesterase CpdA
LLTASLAEAGGIVKGPWVQHVTPTSAVVRVEVDPPSPVSIEVSGAVGLDGAAVKTITSGDKAALHSIVLEGLTPATRYTYTARGPGESKNAAFTTAPALAEPVPFHFLIYGDNRSDDAAHAAVVRAMTPIKSDLLINTGDFVERGEETSEWQTFFDIEAPLLRERCMVACVGNHEITDGAGTAFIKYFGPNAISAAAGPEQLQGTFRWSNARFFLVNGMTRYRSGSPDRMWLERALSDADEEKGVAWRIVVVHHGPWSSGPHGDNRELQTAGIPSLFKQHKVDLVIAGHDHIYERGVVEGTAYLVSGGGGAPPYRIKSTRNGSKKVESARHFIDASVTEAAINITATRMDTTTIERCGLRKIGGWDCDGEPAPSPAASAGQTQTSAAEHHDTPSATPPATTSASRCGCRAAGGDRNSQFLFGLAIALSGALAIRRKRSRVHFE